MMTNEQKIRILRLHAMGMGYAAIGKEVGIKRDTIKSFISRNKNALLTTRCDFCGRGCGVGVSSGNYYSIGGVVWLCGGLAAGVWRRAGFWLGLRLGFGVG